MNRFSNANQRFPGSRRGRVRNTSGNLGPTTSVRTGGNAYPPPVTSDTVLTFKRRLLLKTSQGNISVNPTTLACSLPGGAAAWPRVRFVKASVWGTTTASIVVNNIGYDGASFEDLGTEGSRRSCVHFKPDRQFSLRWAYTSATTPTWFAITSTADVIVDITVEARGATQGCVGAPTVLPATTEE